MTEKTHPNQWLRDRPNFVWHDFENPGQHAVPAATNPLEGASLNACSPAAARPGRATTVIGVVVLMAVAVLVGGAGSRTNGHQPSASLLCRTCHGR